MKIQLNNPKIQYSFGALASGRMPVNKNADGGKNFDTLVSRVSLIENFYVFAHQI